MRTTTRGRLALTAAALALALLGTSCTGDDEPTSDSSSSGAPSEPPPLATTVKVGTVAGRLPDPAAQQTAEDVAAVVDGWIDAAYVTGEWPRDAFEGAFAGFTPGAARQAEADGRLMTNADIGGRVDGVTATTRVVRVDLLTVKRRVQGATAHVRLVFDTTGTVQRQITVTGRLLLTQDEAGAWQVFAYDVSKGTV